MGPKVLSWEKVGSGWAGVEHVEAGRKEVKVGSGNWAWIGVC